MKMKKVFVLLIALVLYQNASPASYHLYVSPSGNDSNNGKKEQPLATLTGARDRVRLLREQHVITASDTVYIRVLSGNYFMKETLTLTAKDGGTAQGPVIFTADAADRPVFYGGIKTGKFEKAGENIWRVYIPEVVQYGFDFEQVYINGERRFRAQTPNRGDFYRVKETKETVIEGIGGQMALLAGQKMIPHPADAGFLKDISADEMNDVLVVFWHKWDNTRKHIQQINPGDTAFYTVGRGMKPWNHIDSKSRYVVENYRKALDSPGEWYLSKKDGYLYYIHLPGETIETTECMVPTIEKFIEISGDEATGEKAGHLRFENLCFRVSGYRTPFPGNEPAQAATPIEASVMVDFAGHIEFNNCEIAHTGLNAIWFRRKCSNSTVRRCHLHDLGTGGVKIGDTRLGAENEDVTNNITVDNNIIQHGGYVFPCAVGVALFHTRDNTFTHNDIADFRYSGVSVGWVWGYSFSPSKRNRIEFNHIHHLGWGELSDMGGVYTLGPSEGTSVSNNVIHHVYAWDYGGWGLYTDEGSTGILMENNLVYACKSAGFHQHYGKENIIRNNIFALIKTSAIQISRIEEHLSYTFTYNIIYQENGEIISDVWGGDNGTKIKVNFDRNCYWKTSDPSPKFYGLSFTEWKKLGRDKNSVVADPQFIDPINYDFRFRKTSNARKINFKPFDYSKAGVYGSQSWKEKSRMPVELELKFNEAIKKLLN
jgi:hypothetical protein